MGSPSQCKYLAGDPVQHSSTVCVHIIRNVLNQYIPSQPRMTLFADWDTRWWRILGVEKIAKGIEAAELKPVQINKDCEI